MNYDELFVNAVVAKHDDVMLLTVIDELYA